MNRRTLLAAAAALAATTAASSARAQGGRTRIVFWHAMMGVLTDEVNRICAEFNAAQQGAEIVPVFKGTYAETLTAAIAAWRANPAPWRSTGSCSRCSRSSMSGRCLQSGPSSSRPRYGCWPCPGCRRGARGGVRYDSRCTPAH